MSDSTDETPTEDSVDLTKPAAAERAAKTRGAGAASADAAASAAPADAVVPPTRPRSLELVVYLLGLQIVLGFVSAIAIRAATSGLTDYVFEHFKKDNDQPYLRTSAADRAKVADLVTNQQHGALIGAIVFGIALAALAFSLRRYRSASVARWALVVVMIFNGGPVSVVPVGGLPVALNVIRVVTGVVWLAILVLLFVPDSRAYFKACKAVMMPAGTPPRPGLRDLLGGRGMASGTLASSPSSSASSTPSSAPRQSSARQKSKSRAEEAAVAKGAELARSRAKASKSRKTEV